MDIYLDSDAHKVLSQVLQLGRRYALEVYIATRDYLEVDGNVHLILIEDQQVNRGAWIVGNIRRGDICVTGDAELAAGCIHKGAMALTPLGRQWLTEARADDFKSLSDNLAERWAPDPRLFARRLEDAIALGRGAAPQLFASPRGVGIDLPRAAISRAAHG